VVDQSFCALGIRAVAPYAARVQVALRFIGLLNAAVWIGAAVFFTLGIGPAVFSAEMKRIFGDFYPGIVAQILLVRYFKLHIICGIIALIHLALDTFYARRVFSRVSLAVIAVPLGIALVGGFFFQPKLRGLHATMYSTSVESAEREQARRQFGIFHGISSSLNLVAMILLTAHLWRVANPPEPARFVSTQKFRG
jgi:hypothetical protein